MFRFTIRDVLWLTALVAVGAAWCLDHAKTRIDWRRIELDKAYLREQASREKLRADRSEAANALMRRALNVKSRPVPSNGITQPETAQR